MRPVLKLENCTITHLTPDAEVRAVARRLGFSDLDPQLEILVPIRRDIRLLDERLMTYDESTIEERLADHDQRIFLEHRPYNVGHLLIEDGDEYCYILYTHVVRHRLPYCHIHYSSNKRIYGVHERAIRASLLRNHDARFVVVDRRKMAGIEFQRSFKFWPVEPALYKSPDVRPDQIDNLYSDVVFLKLSTLPDLSHELTRRARRWSRFGA